MIVQNALTKSSCALEESECLHFHSMFGEINGSTDFTTEDFSQKHLFADIFYPTVPSLSRSDNISNKKTSNHGYNISILHEIRNKKQKIEFLKRRFG